MNYEPPDSLNMLNRSTPPPYNNKYSGSNNNNNSLCSLSCYGSKFNS